MRKIFVAVISVVMLLLLCTSSYAAFGELSYKAENGFVLLSDGGEGAVDSFGFALSDGFEVMHLYHIGGSFSEPYSAVLRGLPADEIEIRQFSETDGVFTYGTPVYVTNGSTVTTLAEVAAAATLEISGFVDKSLYRAAEKAEIDSITASACVAFASADRRYAIDSALKSAKSALSALKTDAQYNAEELASNRASAIAEIEGYADLSLYRAAEKSEIERIVSETKNLINSYTVAADMENAVASAKSQIDLLKTDAEYYAEELAVLKSSAVSELNSFVNPEDYRAAEQSEIENIITETTALIHSRMMKEDVVSDLESAKRQLSLLKTDEQYKAEELASNRASAIAEIEGYADLSLYRAAEKSEIESIVAETVELINSYTTESDMVSAVEAAKEAINLLKTDAEYYAEELAVLKSSAVSELNSFVNIEDYRAAEQAEIEGIISEATVLINSLRAKEDVNSGLSSAKQRLSAVKTDAEYYAEELAELKEACISELSGIVNKEDYRAAEQEEIDEIISSAEASINSRTVKEAVTADLDSAKQQLSEILTADELTANAAANEEVLGYLQRGVDQLTDPDTVVFRGKEAKIVNIVVPVMKLVIADGSYGSILITSEYVKSTYDKEINGENGVKEIYNSMTELEESSFSNKLTYIDPDVVAFLREYFL